VVAALGCGHAAHQHSADLRLPERPAPERLLLEARSAWDADLLAVALRTGIASSDTGARAS
jgi:hypothetical protein